MPEAQQLIYDWNTVEAPDRPSRPVAIHDETLRDGIQGPSVRDPDIDHKLHFLHLADELGVASIDLGLPGSGPRAMADGERLAAEIRDQRLHIKPLCAFDLTDPEQQAVAFHYSNLQPLWALDNMRKGGRWQPHR